MCCGENAAGHFEGKYQRLSGDYADGVVCRLASSWKFFLLTHTHNDQSRVYSGVEL